MDSTASTRGDRAFLVFALALSAGVLAFLAWLLLFHRGLQGEGPNLRFLPAVNAACNATAAMLLVAGRWAIAKKRVELHRALMVAAVAASAVFLLGYLAYHAVHGDTKFGGEGAVRVVYLAVLATHVLLSAAVPPLVLLALYFAFKKRFPAHKKVTRVLHPVWLYVSVTGVIVFVLLRPYYPG